MPPYWPKKTPLCCFHPLYNTTSTNIPFEETSGPGKVPQRKHRIGRTRTVYDAIPTTPPIPKPRVGSAVSPSTTTHADPPKPRVGSAVSPSTTTHADPPKPQATLLAPPKSRHARSGTLSQPDPSSSIACLVNTARGGTLAANASWQFALAASKYQQRGTYGASSSSSVSSQCTYVSTQLLEETLHVGNVDELARVYRGKKEKGPSYSLRWDDGTFCSCRTSQLKSLRDTYIMLQSHISGGYGKIHFGINATGEYVAIKMLRLKAKKEKNLPPVHNKLPTKLFSKWWATPRPPCSMWCGCRTK